jgi:hypothetical protein
MMHRAFAQIEGLDTKTNYQRHRRVNQNQEKPATVSGSAKRQVVGYDLSEDIYKNSSFF